MIILLLMFILIVSIYCIATFDDAKNTEDGFDGFKLLLGILGLSLIFLYFDALYVNLH